MKIENFKNGDAWRYSLESILFYYHEQCYYHFARHFQRDEWMQGECKGSTGWFPGKAILF